MKTAYLIVVALASLALNLTAEEAPRGQLLELHSCELYTGGCTASSEVTLKGHYSLTAWKFDQTGLSGLAVVVLQVSPDNLAVKAAPSEAVVYLPAQASSAQREALGVWVASQVPQARIKATRVLPITFFTEGVKTSLRVGDQIRLASGALQPCGWGGCGESLWYRPQVATALFTVGMTRESEVKEPVLQLTWRELNQRNIFVANFDSQKKAAVEFTSCGALCDLEMQVAQK